MADWVLVGEVTDSVEIESGETTPETPPKLETPPDEHMEIEQIIEPEYDDENLKVWFRGTATVPEIKVEVPQPKIEVPQPKVEVTVEPSETSKTEAENEVAVEEKTKVPWWVWVLAVSGGILGLFSILRGKGRE